MVYSLRMKKLSSQNRRGYKLSQMSKRESDWKSLLSLSQLVQRKKELRQRNRRSLTELPRRRQINWLPRKQRRLEQRSKLKKLKKLWKKQSLLMQRPSRPSNRLQNQQLPSNFERKSFKLYQKSKSSSMQRLKLCMLSQQGNLIRLSFKLNQLMKVETCSLFSQLLEWLPHQFLPSSLSKLLRHVSRKKQLIQEKHPKSRMITVNKTYR